METSERSHRCTLPRLRGGWCTSVIDSFRHGTHNLPRIAVVSQLRFRIYFRLLFLTREILRALARESLGNSAKLAATTRVKLAPSSSTGRSPIIRRRSRSGGTIRPCELYLMRVARSSTSPPQIQQTQTSGACERIRTSFTRSGRGFTDRCS